MLPGNGWLNDWWRDALSVFGVTLTIGGLLLAIWQIRRAVNAAEAAKLAAENALFESRKSFLRFVSALAHRFVNEINVHIENSTWQVASVRMDDLASQLMQLTHTEQELHEAVRQLRHYSTACKGLTSGTRKRFPLKKRLSFSQGLQDKIEKKLSPLSE
ncbi:MAG: hypothetical protein L0Y72_16790 [Gemmataceae bacterium]|nr:hypothetical protein [Gemmataceae bacterium]MCI0740708.1 hypothetical protein [Gemmataceae bacterium]